MPRTTAGKNLVIKNSVMALAWFLIQHQVIPDLEHMLDKWYTMSWSFFEGGANIIIKSKGGPTPNRHHTRARVERRVLVQDYAEGGQRCLDTEAFTRALYAKQISRLLHPEPHPGKNLVAYFVNRTYGGLKMGHRLYFSNCDFTALRDPTPLYWRTVLKIAGSFPSPTPLTTVRSKLIQRPMDPSQESGDPDEWYEEDHMTEPPLPPPTTPDQPSLSPVELLMQPLNYNQLIQGPWSGLTTDPLHYIQHSRKTTGATKLPPCTTACCYCTGSHRKPQIMGHCRLLHSSATRQQDADAILKRGLKWAGWGITHLAHILSNHDTPGGDLCISTWDEMSLKLRSLGVPRQAMTTARHEYMSLLSGLPTSWYFQVATLARTMAKYHIHLRALASRTPTLTPGKWYQDANGIVAQAGPKGKIGESYTPSSTHTLEHSPHPMDTSKHREEVVVWEQKGLPHSQMEWLRADDARADKMFGLNQTMTKRLKSVHVFGGPVLDRRMLWGDNPICRAFSSLGPWGRAYPTTDRDRDVIPLASVAATHLYYIQLAHNFTPLRTLDPAHILTGNQTSWVDLLEHAPAPQDPHPQEQNKEETTEHLVEFILDHRNTRVGEEIEYLVKWSEYDEDESSWEPRDVLEGNPALARYEQSILDNDLEGAGTTRPGAISSLLRTFQSLQNIEGRP